MLLTSLDGLPQLDKSFFDSRLSISDDLITFIGFTTVQRNFPIESTDHHRSFSSDVLV